MVAGGALIQSSMKQILLAEFTTAVMKPTEFLWVMLRHPRSEQQNCNFKQLRVILYRYVNNSSCLSM